MRAPSFHPVATSWILRYRKSLNQSFSRSILDLDKHLIAANHPISTAC
jgi:hypothetical protein